MKKDRDYAIFCENVKRLRRKNCLSRREMAKCLHIGVATLVLIESGILPKWVTVNIMFQIYWRFGISFTDQCSCLISLQES